MATCTHMKAKLKKHFGNQIMITKINGKSNIVKLRSTAKIVLQEFHDRQKDGSEMEKIHLIQTAAKLIRIISNQWKPETKTIHHPMKLKVKSSVTIFSQHLSRVFGGNQNGKGCRPKASINQTSYHASSLSSSFTCIIAGCIGFTTLSLLCPTISHQIALLETQLADCQEKLGEEEREKAVSFPSA